MLCITAMQFSCNHGPTTMDQLNHIKEVGNSNPDLALEMLDSLEADKDSWPKHTQMTYDLLDIRLHDKAYITAKSDLKVRPVVAYFEKHGTNKEKQEAYYYEGSVYRDLQNYPRAITCFQQSRDCCGQGEDYDTLMLRNIYSNLRWLYFGVQDYINATDMSQKEYETEKALNDVKASTVQNLGATQFRMGQTEKARESFLEALRLLQKEKPGYDLVTASYLLYHFSRLRMPREASICYQIVRSTAPLDSLSSDGLLSLAEYYEMTNHKDSAINCYQTVLKRRDNLENMYDGSRHLFKLYHEAGDEKMASYYGNVFVQVSDSLNLGKRQMLAATANNLYKYHRDANREKKIMEQSETYMSMALWTLIILLPTTIASLILYYRKKQKSMKEILSQQRTIDNYSEETRRLKKEVAEKKEELEKNKAKLDETQDLLNGVKAQINQSKAKIEEQEKELEEKIRQNESLTRLLRRAELENKTEDIINLVRTASRGEHKMTSKEWERFIKAVNKLYPDFQKALVAKHGHIESKELRVCYLLRIDLSNPEIINVTGLPHSTVWRWGKKYDWIKGNRKGEDAK